jgi:hypothetical protein
MSIHQPRSDVFALLDDVVLLSRGRLVWSGTSPGMLEHFAKLGLPCPPNTNPAEHALDISSVDLRNDKVEQDTRARLAMLLGAWETRFARDQGEEAAAVVSSPEPASQPAAAKARGGSDVQQQDVSFCWCFPLMLQRSFLNLKRQPTLMSSRISQGLFFGLILALFYAPIGQDQDSVQNRMGLLYEVGYCSSRPSRRAPQGCQAEGGGHLMMCVGGRPPPFALSAC